MAFSLLSTQAAVQVKEKLNLAPVAVMTKTGVLVSWRYLSSEGDAKYNVYRNNTLIKSDISDVTQFLDADGKAGDTYRIVSTTGKEESVQAWDNIYKTISLKRPSPRKSIVGNLTGRYRPSDISVGDVDADGDYELIVKWMPDNQRDSGKDGIASATYIYCYEMDGTQKWCVDIGDGIRSGAHTVQFLVYDFDGDGKAEMICKTTVDSKDGKGAYVTQAGDDVIKAIPATGIEVNSKGHVTKGAEFLTVFNGETGAAMKTIWYSPNRAMVDFPTSDGTYSSKWDSNYNRGERYNAAVAYLDGQGSLPSAIMQRGYYNYCYIWAVDWDGTNLKTRWLHKGTSKTAWSVVNASGSILANESTNPVSSQGKSSYGQGVHGISVGDVNGDGKDEIVIGAATIASDGKLMCATGFGHGDAIHLADLVPDRPGLEIMMPHEEKSSFGDYGYDVHDASTGEILVSATGTADNGRGMACDFFPKHVGSEFWSSADGITRDCANGTQVSASKADTNFRIYWTGDPFDQTFDGRYDSNTGECSPRIRSVNSASGNIQTFMEFKNYGNPQTCYDNSTKATPCLQADILGDWREEIIMTNYETDWKSATCDLLIYSTPEPTAYKVPCLMEDHVYRMGIAWQNSSYNQPPHLGYSLAESLGVDRSTYKTTLAAKNNAPEGVVPPPPTSGEEVIKAAGEDKEKVVGNSFTTGENQEITNGASGEYVKMRTSNNGETITISVNPGYTITGIKIEAYSNNTSTTADRSIDLKDITVDGTSAGKTATFPGGTAGQTPATVELTGIEATENIVLSFDNSKIGSGTAGDPDYDAKGKNKQIFAKITISYKQGTSIGQVGEKLIENVKKVVKVFQNGRLIINANGKKYNVASMEVK